MSLFTELATLDQNNPEHVKLAVALAKAKAKHDVTRQKKHRKDPEVLATLLAYRAARNAVREAVNVVREQMEKSDVDVQSV